MTLSPEREPMSHVCTNMRFRANYLDMRREVGFDLTVL